MTRVRALDPNGDMIFGHGSRDFLVDVPAAVVQRAKTRLGLWVGDWFLNTDDGTPYRTAVFGARTNASRDPAIRARLLGTPGCTGITAYASQQEPSKAAQVVACRLTIDTAYGQTLVSTAPATSRTAT